MKDRNLRRGVAALLLTTAVTFPSGLMAQDLQDTAPTAAPTAAPATEPMNEPVAAPVAEPAPAQTGSSDSGDIIVTAQKRAQSLSDVPISITAQTGEQLVDKGIYDVQDLVKVTPGLSYADSGRGVPVFSLRGVGFFEQAIGGRPTVSVYLDEAPLPFSLMAKGASFDLERVEVLKGPQGTLFGQSSTGGAINYIAAKPTSSFHAGVIASYGRFDTADVQGYVSGPITSTLNARVAVRTLQSGDYQRSFTRDDTLGSQDFTQARLLLDWHPTDRLKVALNLNGFHDGSDTQAAQLIGTRRASPLIALLNNYPAAPRNDRAADWTPGQDFDRDNEFYQASGRIDYEVADALTMTSLTSYSHEQVEQYSDGDGSALVNYSNRVNGRVSSLSQELRASGELGRLTYIVGGSYSRDRSREVNEIIQPYAISANVAGSPTLLDDVATSSNQNFDTYAAFGDLTYALTDKLRVNGGVRYTKQALDYDGCLLVANQNSATAYTVVINGQRRTRGLAPIAGLAPGQCVSLDQTLNPTRAFGTLDENNVSWRAGVDFKPVPDTLLYVNVSKGFKAGSSPAPAATSVVQFQPVSQESVLAYEAGVKTSLFDKMVEITGAGFYYDYRDKQLLGRNIFSPNIFGALSALINIPRSRIYGAEAQVTLRPVRGFTLLGAATYLDTKVQSTFANFDIIGQPINLKNSPFPYTPKWQVVFDGENRIPVSSGLFGTFGWNASYRTSTTAGFGGDPRLKIDSYWLLDLRLGIEDRAGKWKAQVYGRNVLDEYYWNNVSAAVDNVRRYAGMPATYGLQVSYAF